MSDAGRHDIHNEACGCVPLPAPVAVSKPAPSLAGEYGKRAGRGMKGVWFSGYGPTLRVALLLVFAAVLLYEVIR